MKGSPAARWFDTATGNQVLYLAHGPLPENVTSVSRVVNTRNGIVERLGLGKDEA